MTQDTARLEETLGYTFKDPGLLSRALMHSSAVQTRTDSNERMEFLGDRILGLCICEMLYHRFPDEREGDLGYRFTALVRAEALSVVAEKIDLGAYLVMAPGEDDSGGRNNHSILANACEALIAAIYLDAGLTQAQRFIQQYWSELLEKDLKPQKDAKTTLQEWAQGRKKPIPAYVVQGRSGPDHAPVFKIEVQISGLTSVSGNGTSKRLAEQNAAEKMLNVINQTQ